MTKQGLVLHSAFCILTFLAAGCQTVSTSSQPQQITIAKAPMPDNGPLTVDEAVGSDACSNRLHDIEGALLMYYLANKQMPASLEEIKPYAEAGTELKFTCPVSNEPYGYSPSGLVASGYNKRIVVWDPTPAHHGVRWCIVMAKPHPGESLVPEVVQMSEKVFDAFVPATD